MNTPIDLDALRGQWGALDRRIDNSLELDVAALRASLSRDVYSAFRRHSHWLLVALVFDAVALLALMVFGLAHLHLPVYATSALALTLLMTMEAATDIHAWRTLRTLDFNAPVLAVRQCLSALRARRLRTTGAFILFSIALWFPFLLVLVKGVFGGDLARVLHWSVLVGNIVFGLLLIPFGAWIGRRVAQRLRGNVGFEQFLDDAAGKSWSAANHRWDAYARSEERIARGEAASLLRAQSGGDAIAPHIAQPLAALKRALGMGIVLAALPVCVIAVFNATHGGQVRFLLPGLLLHFACLAQMVANIAHLHAVRRMDLHDDPARTANTLAWMVTQRLRLVRVTWTALPLLCLAAVVVLGKAIFAIDVYGALGAKTSLAAIATAAAGCWWMSRVRIDASSRVAHVLCSGVIGRSDALERVLQRCAAEFEIDAGIDASPTLNDPSLSDMAASRGNTPAADNSTSRSSPPD